MNKITAYVESTRNTPWGKADGVMRIGSAGILCVQTPSHGGFFVPTELLSRIPEEQQLFAQRWSGSRNWFEEDLCAVSVMLAFPELFAKPPTPASVEYLHEAMNRKEVA